MTCRGGLGSLPSRTLMTIPPGGRASRVLWGGSQSLQSRQRRVPAQLSTCEQRGAPGHLCTRLVPTYQLGAFWNRTGARGRDPAAAVVTMQAVARAKTASFIDVLYAAAA